MTPWIEIFIGFGVMYTILRLWSKASRADAKFELFVAMNYEWRGVLQILPTSNRRHGLGLYYIVAEELVAKGLIEMHDRPDGRREFRLRETRP